MVCSKETSLGSIDMSIEGERDGYFKGDSLRTTDRDDDGYADGVDDGVSDGGGEGNLLG